LKHGVFYAGRSRVTALVVAALLAMFLAGCGAPTGGSGGGADDPGPIETGSSEVSEKTASGEVIEVPIERTVKHRPQRDGDRLRFLSDVIYPPDPIYEVLSVGDLVIGAGIVVTVYAGSRRRSPRPNASTTRSS